jgi:murein DD-endopeptidase MepM/ murein hydrolase activator NlpD
MQPPTGTIDAGWPERAVAQPSRPGAGPQARPRGSGWWLTGAVSCCALVAGLSFTSVAWLASRQQEHRLKEQVSRLEASLAAERADDTRRTQDLVAQLAIAAGRAKELGQARDRALQLAAQLKDGLSAEAASVSVSRSAREALDQRLAEAEGQARAASQQLDDSRQTEKALHARVAQLEARMEQLRTTVETATDHLRGWLAGHVETVTSVLGDLGIDASRLLARASAHERLGGQGGPLQLVSADDGQASLRVPWAGTQSPLVLNLERLQAAQRLLAALPLAAPLTDFQVTSAFGVRADPIEGGRAIHEGLDLAAPRGTIVHAPSAGRVVRVGRDGAYGLMVEIDHGLGLVTRYAHLRRALVKPGDEVQAYDPLGIVGSTGRSTGPHLHYEVRIDGHAVDPAAFIEAGRRLVHVLQG